jgi:ribokinase
MFDFLAVGDAGIDTFVDIHDASVHCSVDKKKCELTLRYADKILVEGMTSKTAYNGMNAAVGAARLGLKTGFFAMVGGDAAGERILRALKREKISTKHVRVESKLRSNASVVLNYQGERTILVYHEDFHYRLKEVPATKWIYLTTMGHRYPKIYEAIGKHVAKGKSKLAFNPGTIQLKAGPKKLKNIFAHTSILFLNKEEAELVTGVAEDIKSLLRGMRKLGPQIAVLTDGPNGAFAHDGHKFYHMPVLPMPVVERTGCGDAFGTAFTSAISLNKDIVEALRWGSADSGGVLQEIGPQDGLRTQTQIKSLLKKNSRIKVSEI